MWVTWSKVTFEAGLSSKLDQDAQGLNSLLFKTYSEGLSTQNKYFNGGAASYFLEHKIGT